MDTPRYDVLIVGAGPAGLSAALLLGRCRRRVLVCDTGTPRSWASKEMHGFLTRDAICPDEFRDIARRELGKFPNVELRSGEVVAIHRRGDRFVAALRGGDQVSSRKVLVATGLQDELPAVEGFHELFGKSVFQCPYCDAYNVRDQALGVYGKGTRGLEMSRALTAWTSDIVLFTDGPTTLRRIDREHLERNGVRIEQEPMQRLVSEDGRLSAVELKSGRRVPRTAIFFNTSSYQQSTLAAQVGCRFNQHGGVRCGKYEATDVPGVYVAGNIIRDVHLAIVAAAEGTKAALGINKAITREDFRRRATGKLEIEHPTIEPQREAS